MDRDKTRGQLTRAGRGRRQGSWLTFDMEDGLPNASIDAIVEEPGGQALWLGTHAGASRFDGQFFETITTHDGLAHDYVTALGFDQDGILWVGTKGGLSRFDGQHLETFTTQDGLAANEVRAIALGPDGLLWVGTGGGLSRFDGQHFETFTTQDGLADNEVHAIALDPDGLLWVGTLGGLSRFGGQHFETFTTQDGLADNEVHDLGLDRDGLLWVGTEGGLSRFDGQHLETRMTGTVRSIRPSRSGDLWVGTLLEGACRLDGQRVDTFTSQDGLGHDRIESILEGQDGSLWFATFGGLSRCDLYLMRAFTSQDGLASNGVMDVCHDRNDRLLVATWKGISYKDGARFLPLLPSEAQNVWTMLEDGQGRLWYTSYFSTGVGCYDGSQVKTFSEKDGLVSDRVQAITQDRAGNLWFVSRDGVSCFDGERFKNYSAEDGPGLGSVLSIYCDRAGVLWFGTTRDGLTCYDGHTFKNYTIQDGLPDNGVISIFEDRDGILWLGTEGGLSRFDGRAFKNFTAKDGMGKNEVLSTFQDDRGHLWFATRGDGIKLYDGRVFQTLARAHGLPSSSIQQVRQDPEGFFWIATEAGLVHYRRSVKKPRLAITQLVADESFSPRQRISISDTQKLLLIKFTGGTLRTASGHMVYRYWLQGPPGTEEGEHITHRAEVAYHHLPVGTYTFYVQAIDPDLNYSDPARVDFEIVPDPKIQSLTQVLNAGTTQETFIGESSALKAVQAQLAEVAGLDVTVLIQGETGTGKGVAARTLHQLSARARGPLIAVNCGALPEGLIESELFGHEKGAFTGARARQLGKVELAAGGTLFLDEIGDMSMSAQIRLLHVLQEKTFQRVGGSQTLKADIRVVAATNRDLLEMIQAGTFRQDLFFRLQVFPVHLPPLRARGDDIVTLAIYFMQSMATHLHKSITGFSPQAQVALAAYSWPGNVRELEHAVQRAVIVCAGDAIEVEDLALTLMHTQAQAPAMRLTPEEYERAYLRQTLDACKWVVKGDQGAAAQLGMAPSTLSDRMKKLGLRRS